MQWRAGTFVRPKQRRRSTALSGATAPLGQSSRLNTSARSARSGMRRTSSTSPCAVLAPQVRHSSIADTIGRVGVKLLSFRKRMKFRLLPCLPGRQRHLLDRALARPSGKFLTSSSQVPMLNTITISRYTKSVIGLQTPFDQPSRNGVHTVGVKVSLPTIRRSRPLSPDKSSSQLYFLVWSVPSPTMSGFPSCVVLTHLSRLCSGTRLSLTSQNSESLLMVTCSDGKPPHWAWRADRPTKR